MLSITHLRRFRIEHGQRHPIRFFAPLAALPVNPGSIGRHRQLRDLVAFRSLEKLGVCAGVTADNDQIRTAHGKSLVLEFHAIEKGAATGRAFPNVHFIIMDIASRLASSF